MLISCDAKRTTGRQQITNRKKQRTRSDILLPLLLLLLLENQRTRSDVLLLLLCLCSIQSTARARGTAESPRTFLAKILFTIKVLLCTRRRARRVERCLILNTKTLKSPKMEGAGKICAHTTSRTPPSGFFVVRLRRKQEHRYDDRTQPLSLRKIQRQKQQTQIAPSLKTSHRESFGRFPPMARTHFHVVTRLVLLSMLTVVTTHTHTHTSHTFH